MYGNELNQYLFELSQYIRRQDETIQALEKRIDMLEAEIKHKNGTTIEKVEYKFDQLKVETLSGTLHIGISPDELKNIEDLAVQQHGLNEFPIYEQQLTGNLQEYLQVNGPTMIRNLSNEHAVSIDESDYELLIQDMQKQIPNRIAFYKENAVMNKPLQANHDLPSFIENKIIEEFHLSLANYMRSIANKGEK
ncbi:spore germination protein GerPC [Oceanobacillus bengalensis]|uniref:Spore gernimation protein n=1 Tax=Oceanobacillus bengalensis TaxID=1435466 RepID=A0A494Z8B5_9BACI|nr:spore germination protein GerPC [Oceanobacillus bengalensis]RKQ18833.1 spore gernimation protein [Oceanobacillus bengalensis]